MLLERILLGMFRTEPIKKKNRQPIQKIESRKKLIFLDVFGPYKLKPIGLVQFSVYNLRTGPNRTYLDSSITQTANYPLLT